MSKLRFRTRKEKKIKKLKEKGPQKLRDAARRRVGTGGRHNLSKHWSSSCELRDNCKGIKHITTSFGLVRAGTAAELSLWSKLGESLCQSSVEALPSTNTIQAKVNIFLELSLFSKLGRVTASKFDWGAMVGGDPKGYQGTKDNLHSEISSNNPHVWIETSTEWWQAINQALRAWLGQSPTH